jgi:hypothetical protein
MKKTHNIVGPLGYSGHQHPVAVQAVQAPIPASKHQAHRLKTALQIALYLCGLENGRPQSLIIYSRDVLLMGFSLCHIDCICVYMYIYIYCISNMSIHVHTVYTYKYPIFTQTQLVKEKLPTVFHLLCYNQTKNAKTKNGKFEMQRRAYSPSNQFWDWQINTYFTQTGEATCSQAKT